MTGIYVLIEGKIFLHKNAVQLCPSLSRLTEPELKYLVTVYDYVGSPLRGQPESRRKELAVSFFFPTEENKKERIIKIESSEQFKTAILELISIIYDSDKQSYDTYIEKIEVLNAQVRTCQPAELKKLLESTASLREECERLEIKIEKKDANTINIQLKGGRQLSFLETWKRNREQFARMYERTQK